MLTEVKNNFRYFINAIKVGLKSAMAYKVSFLIQAIFMLLNNSFFLVFWGVVFSHAGNDSGITFNNVLLLWSFSTISYGITYFFFGGTKKINEYIITGAMDSFLLQPKNVLLNVATSKCEFAAMGDMLYGIVIGFIACHGDLSRYALLLILGLFGSIFFISTEVMCRSISVWIGDTKSIANRYTEMLLITFSTYPENIFKTGIKIMLYTVVPVAYLAYLPAKLVESLDLKIIIPIILAGIIYFVASVKVFNKAMKNYESGNSMAMKS